MEGGEQGRRGVVGSCPSFCGSVSRLICKLTKMERALDLEEAALRRVHT